MGHAEIIRKRGTHVPHIPIVIETGMGTIRAELYEDSAPGTVANFLRYIDAGFFDEGRFHRTVRLDNNANSNLKTDNADAGIATSDDGAMPNDAITIEVIQGGINAAHIPEQFPAIALERTRDTSLAHQDGTLSMARRTPDSAVSDFFICINDQPSLDFGGQRNVDGQGFAAFGGVTDGMDVVRAIQQAPSEGQQLAPPVPIISIRRAE
jgi:peptidyl-prolyl cis-trans isomerase A (cyclophilin A)